MGLKTWGRGVLSALRGKAGASGDFQPSGFCSGTSKYVFEDDASIFPSLGKILVAANETHWDEYGPEKLQQAYGLNAVVYACCNLIATSLSEAPLEVGWYDAKRIWHSKPNEPVLNIVKYPNPWYSFQDFHNVWVTRKLLTGAAFILKFRNGLGEVCELWPIPTSWVTVALKKVGIEGYWLWRGKPNEVWVPAEDMFFDRWMPDPSSIFGYVSPLMAALHDLQLDFLRESYMKETLDNIRRPGMILEQNAPDGVKRAGLTKTQRESIRETIKNLGHGAVNIFPPGISVRFPGIVADLDWASTEGLIASRICMAFGVKPILIGARIGLKAGTADYDQTVRSFYDETLQPHWTAIESVWTRSMFRHEGKNPRWEFNFFLRDIAELQEDANKLMDRGTRALSAGGITVNEFRTKYANLDPISDGQVYLRAQNIVIDPVVASAEEAAESHMPEPEPAVIPDTAEDEDE